MAGKRTFDRVPDADRKPLLLVQSALFRGLPDREMRRLARASVMLRVPKGRPLLQPGRPAAALYLVDEGAITLYRGGTDGRSIILGVMNPGDVFDEASLISGSEVKVLAEAAQDAVVCRVPRATILKLLIDYPVFRARLTERIAQRLVVAEQRMIEVAYSPVERRVALALLRSSNRGTEPVLLRHADIASIAGTRRETVTKLLNTWSIGSILKLGRGRIIILDADRLIFIAGGES